VTNAHKKTRSFKGLAANEDQVLTTSCDVDHTARITRLGGLKQHSKNQEEFLFGIVDLLAAYDNKPSKEETKLALSYANRLMGCGNFLLFKNYYTVGDVRLSKMQACQVHLLCPFCAAVRAAKAAKRYQDRVNYLLDQKTSLKPVFITLTVKNGKDLSERKKHLSDAFQHLVVRRRDSLKKKRGYVEFSKLDGAVFSYEVTRNKKTGDWHPHLHMFALANAWIDRDRLVQEWHQVTGDSMVVDVRRVKKHPEYGYGEAFAEVCKYALKFSDLSHGDTWDAFKALKGQRLSGSLGSLWGVKLPENLEDDPLSDDELPYLEMLYQFKKNAGYDLAITRHVDAKPVATCEERTERETCERLERTAVGSGGDDALEGGGGGCTDDQRRTNSVEEATVDKSWQRFALRYPAAFVVSMMPDFAEQADLDLALMSDFDDTGGAG